MGWYTGGPWVGTLGEPLVGTCTLGEPIGRYTGGTMGWYTGGTNGRYTGGTNGRYTGGTIGRYTGGTMGWYTGGPWVGTLGDHGSVHWALA